MSGCDRIPSALPPYAGANQETQTCDENGYVDRNSSKFIVSAPVLIGSWDDNYNISFSFYHDTPSVTN